MTMEPPEKVVACYTRLTGIEYRIPSHAVMRQAALFARQFTLEELEITVLWIKRQISQRKSGFTEASYSWKRLFGEHGAADEFQVFQERLGLARVEQRRGWHPRLETARPAAPVMDDCEPATFRAWLLATYPRADQGQPWARVREDVRREFSATQMKI